MKCSNISFMGTTNVYALTDTHQDTRKTRTLLSKVIDDSNKNDNVLLLNAGDMFKGIYPKSLEKDSYIKAKELSPSLEIVTALGNNDFGFNSSHLDYLISTVKEFYQKGIKVVCANVFDSKTNKRPFWLKPYTIVERDGDRTFVTGFCLDDLNIKGKPLSQKDKSTVTDEIKEAIEKENPDNVIVLNHDYLNSSVEIYEDFKQKDIPLDVIVGGHDHTPKGHFHPEENIFYPSAFANSLIHFDIKNDSSGKKIKHPEIIDVSNIQINPDMEEELISYEKETGLLDIIAPCIINFYKKYSDPCSLGSFLADEIKEETKTDICLFSTGLTVKPLPYIEEGCITNYDFQKTMMAKLFIKKVLMTPDELKEVLEWSYSNRTRELFANPRFLQASSNLRVDGVCDKVRKKYTINEIYINDKPVLNKDTLISVSVDEFIAYGGQGFNMFNRMKKEDTNIRIDEALKRALIEAPLKYEKGFNYPEYKINERIIDSAYASD